MNLSNSVLIQLVLLCDNSEHTDLLIRKFLNVHDLKMLENRLAKCYESISKSRDELELTIHLEARLTIERQIEWENRRSVCIEKNLDTVLEVLPKEMIEKYELLLKDFKEGKY